MTNIRVGLIGAGGIATAHAQTVKSLPGVDLVGIADLDIARARRLGDRFGAPAFGSVAQLFADARPAAVHVLLPPEMHARMAIEAMTNGADVLVEKPVCVSEEECRELDAAAKRFGRIVGVNHNVTFDPVYLRLIDVVRDGRIGRVRHVSVYWNVPFGDNTFAAPLYRRFGAGAHMLETGPHPLSLLVRLVGESHETAAQYSQRLRNAPDTWQLALRCEHATADCFIGIDRSFTETRVIVLGEHGTAEADLRLGNVTVAKNSRSPSPFSSVFDTLALAGSLASSAIAGFEKRVRKIPGGGATDDFSPTFRGSIGNFYEAVRTRRALHGSLAEGLAVVRTCLRAIEAARTIETPAQLPKVLSASG